MFKKRYYVGLGLLVFIIFYAFSSLSDPRVVSSRAYSGHTNDADANHFVQAFQKTVGTRLDDCQTCHRAGVAGTDTEKEYNACGYCHLREFPNPKYTFSFDRIKALPVYEQFLLMNATKQKNDEYAFYKGVTVKDLLAAAGIKSEKAAGITVFAPDGFSVDYSNDIDPNAGNAVRGMCVIRINPMPAGYEEYDWKNGWSLIDERKIIVYGYGVTPKTY